tara:strand:- start:597 stop:1574 length:978 start_codon:yes stop_codon:yes gene_type:complete
MKNFINLIVEKLNNNPRVDQFIADKEHTLSRTRIKNLIINSKLKINKKIIKDPSKRIFVGDILMLEIPEPKKLSLKPYKYKLDIIFEDEDLLVINKSAGIAIHPGAGNYDNTIVNALINYNKKLSNISDELRPGIVHRLDKDTSGLILIAKNNQSHENLSNQFNQHTIKRIYQTLIWGKLRPQKGKIETFIKRSSKNRQLMEVSYSKGKKAITNYETLNVFESKNVPTFSLVECKLETGRTHQIRVHMAFKGNNILGDKKYKKRFKKIKNIDFDLEKTLINLDRQFLHAKSIGFTHPRTGKDIEFASNLPKDLELVLKKLKNASK